jgi:hypothetical protein
MSNQASQKILGLVTISLVFLNACGPGILLDTPQAAITTATTSPTSPLLPTSTSAPTTLIASTGAITTATTGQSTVVDNIIPTATQVFIAPTLTASAFTAQAVACVTTQSDPEAFTEVRADTLILSSTTIHPAGQQLPLASGLKIAFSDMRSFEVKQVLEKPSGITVEVIHLNGDITTGNVPVQNSVDAHLEGKAKNGDFWLYLSKVQKVIFMSEGGCQ